ncbi:MAG TPA: hypothetical protein VGL81_25140 [Polyangiaceae bacterium]|jgi:hypothetical protein
MRATPLLLAATVLVRAGVASADETTAPAPSKLDTAAPETKQEHPSLLDRAHTVAEAEAGIIVLPSAPISASNRGGSTPLGSVGNGDATVLTGVHLLYRATREWAFGAGALLAPRPTSDPNAGGGGDLPRTHSRSYLFLGGEIRYFPLRSRWLEGYFGLTSGALIIADRFSTNNVPAVPSILGTSTVTVSTEGFAVGLEAGLHYLVNDSFVIGLALRADRWILPAEKPFSQETSCDPIGDCPTLTGSVAAFELGLTFGYRIPL